MRLRSGWSPACRRNVPGLRVRPWTPTVRFCRRSAEERFHVALQRVVVFRLSGERDGCRGPAGGRRAEGSTIRPSFSPSRPWSKPRGRCKTIQRRFKVEVVIETVSSIPDDIEGPIRGRRQSAISFATGPRLAGTDEGAKGIYVLICKEPALLANRTPIPRLAAKAFKIYQRDTLVKKMLPLLNAEHSMRPSWRWSTASSRRWKSTSESLRAGRPRLRRRFPASRSVRLVAVVGKPLGLDLPGRGRGVPRCG